MFQPAMSVYQSVFVGKQIHHPLLEGLGLVFVKPDLNQVIIQAAPQNLSAGTWRSPQNKRENIKAKPPFLLHPRNLT